MSTTYETFSTAHPSFSVSHATAEDARMETECEDYETPVLFISADETAIIEGDLTAFADQVLKALGTTPIIAAAKAVVTLLSAADNDIASHLTLPEATGIATLAHALSMRDDARNFMAAWANADEDADEHEETLAHAWGIQTVDGVWEHTGRTAPAHRCNVRVSIEGVGRFTAFEISDHRWNGWVMPSFTREQADQIARALAAHPDNGVIEYDATIDAYRHSSPSGETDLYPAREVDGEKVYDLGAGCWVWELDA